VYYEALLIPLPIGLMVGSWTPWWFFVRALTKVLSIPDHAPVRDQPNGVLWLVLCLAAFAGFTAAGGCLGCTLSAWILRWLARPAAAPAGFARATLFDDPMYDHEFDHRL
jgi:hypothetical protein